jgi:hypothetical protein
VDREWGMSVRECEERQKEGRRSGGSSRSLRLEGGRESVVMYKSDE